MIIEMNVKIASDDELRGVVAAREERIQLIRTEKDLEKPEDKGGPIPIF